MCGDGDGSGSQGIIASNEGLCEEDDWIMFAVDVTLDMTPAG